MNTRLRECGRENLAADNDGTARYFYQSHFNTSEEAETAIRGIREISRM